MKNKVQHKWRQNNSTPKLELFSLKRCVILHQLQNLSGCLSSKRHFQDIHPFLNTHFILFRVILSQHALGGRKGYTLDRSAVHHRSNTNICIHAHIHTRSNLRFPVHLRKLQHQEDANTRSMNKDAVCHFKQQQHKHICQADSRLPSAHAFLCIMLINFWMKDQF